MRWQTREIPAHRFLAPAAGLQDPSGPDLIAARDVYVRLRGEGRGSLFEEAANRAFSYAVKAIGNKPLSDYRKADATRYRDSLQRRGLSSSSVRRVMATLRAMVNFAINEFGLDIANPFNGLYIGSQSQDNARKPIPPSVIRDVQQRCVEVDDDRRWLLALISDTGMRLAEATGLLLSDVRLRCEYPHVLVQPHPWRRLKNDGSRRLIPLHGASLWAAHRLQSRKGGFAFPRYCDDTACRAATASATLNKWLKSEIGDHVVHSFRHSLRDRLRAVECPADVVDQIGGWKTNGVGHAYGTGYPLAVISRWMEKIILR